MGSSVNASCPCGYSAEAMIGGGMLNFQDTFLFPAICPKCAEVVTINLLAKTPACRACRSRRVQSYHLDELLGEAGSETVVEWRNPRDWSLISLTDGTYLCPSCGDFTLRFRAGGILWD